MYCLLVLRRGSLRFSTRNGTISVEFRVVSRRGKKWFIQRIDNERFACRFE